MAATKKSTGAAKKAPAKKKTAEKKRDIKYVGSDVKKKKEDWSGNRQYIYTISFIACAVLFSCIAFINGENLWAWIRGSAFAVFGVGFFMLTVLMLAAAVTVSVKKIKKSPMLLVLAGVTLTVLFVSLVHVFTNNSVDVPGASGWLGQIKQSALLGWRVSADGLKLNGGILGAFLGGGFLYCFGKAPAVAIIIILLFVNILLVGVLVMDLFGMSVRDTLTTFGDKRKDKALLRKAGREAEQAEKAELERAMQEKEERRAKLEQKENERKEREMAGYKRLSQAEIDAMLMGTDKKQEVAPAPQRPVRSPFTVPINGASESAIPLSTAVAQAERGVKITADETPASQQNITNPHKDIADAAANEARSKAAQTKAALDSYTEEKKRARKSYVKPPIDCLRMPKVNLSEDCSVEIKTTAQKLVDTLKSFNVETTLTGVCRGPSVTRYELQPAPGVKISKITNLADDIALSLAASGVRIEAPIPNKSAVGIEVPNKTRSMVTLREILISDEFRNASGKLNVALGKDITGNINCADLSKMPHLLIAGTTGSGKSVCLNCMIGSILYNARPDEVKMILIDPKQVEFAVYDGIPHLLVPVISNARKAAGALAWAVGEMENRYKAFSECGVRDIKGFNKYCQGKKDLSPMPLIVIIIDELNDLMMISPKEVEDSICRLAQKARAAGMHLVVATQRPSVDVITGIIKANIPSRISLSVSSQVDSRTILDAIGAEKLLGNGDMLFNPVGISKPVRIQGAFLSDEEVENVVDFIKNQEAGEYDREIMNEIERQAAADPKKKGSASLESDDEPEDEMFDAAVDAVVNAQVASTTFLQKKLKLGYARASRIMDALYEKGYVGAPDGSKPRKVLISAQQWMEIKMGAPSSSASGDDDDDGQMEFDIFGESL